MEDAPAVHIINHPSVNALSDMYEGVRFMHRKHASVLKDCTLCHHRIPREDGDTYGMPVTLQLLREKEIVPSGCAACHGKPFNEKQLHTPGLKGAYHQLCMDCHRESEQVPHRRGAPRSTARWCAGRSPGRWTPGPPPIAWPAIPNGFRLEGQGF